MGLGSFIAGYAIGRHASGKPQRQSGSERAWQEYQERQRTFNDAMDTIDRIRRDAEERGRRDRY
ncbi:MAG: hypothetical protein UHD09_02435 [Bifidobacterium sp.]|nr:hypothetical protein [Bifidobacterium sp.]